MRRVFLQAMTPAAFIDFTRAIYYKRSDVTETEIREIIRIAAAFSTDQIVQWNVCKTLLNISCSYDLCAAGSQLVFDSGGVATLLNVMLSWPDDIQMLDLACGTLFYIAGRCSASVRHALVSTNGLVYALILASAVFIAKKPGWTNVANSALLLLVQ